MNFSEDTGSQNHLIAAFDPPFSSTRPYTIGLPVRVRVRTTNDGGSDLDAGAGTARIIRPDGLDTFPGDLLGGLIANLVYDGTNWQLLNPAVKVAGDTHITITENPLPYCVDISTIPNEIEAPFIPQITAAELRPGLAILVKVANANSVVNPATGRSPTTIRVNSLSPIPVYANGQGEPQTYALNPNDVKLFTYDGTVFWIEPDAAVRKIGAVVAWVRWSDGDDVNGTGESNAPGIAFKTIRRAYEAMGARYAPNPQLIITIRLGEPTGGTPTTRYKGVFIGPYGGTVMISGDMNGPGSYEIGPNTDLVPAVECIQATAVTLIVQGVRLVMDRPTASPCILVQDAANCVLQNVHFELQNVANTGAGWMYIGRAGHLQFQPPNMTQQGSVIFNGNWATMSYGIWADTGATFWGGNGPPSPKVIVQYWNTTFSNAGYVAINNSRIFNANAALHTANTGGPAFSIGDHSIGRHAWAGGFGAPGHLQGVTSEYGLWLP